MKENIILKNKVHERYILIVDDNAINRKILLKILQDDYNVVEAENGEQALKFIADRTISFSAIILDLVMPIMNGYQFLSELRKTSFADIPVIVTTGNACQINESKAFELGAWDFVGKPYNANILKSRLKNAIVRSETAAFEQLKYLAEYDAVTDIYNKSKYFQATREMLDASTSKQFAFIRFDIARFSLINSFYGTETGDQLLTFIGNELKKLADTLKEMSYGRIEADVFSFCIPYTDKKNLMNIIELLKTNFKIYPIDFDIVATYGIYIAKDLSIPVYKMLDYANLAAKSVKGNYINNYAFYTVKMSHALETEQEIINEMNDALAKEQFIIYLQPKYDLHTNLPAGAEALVRWQHPTKGLISPGIFIPIFERNGFISKLDYYMWRKVCILIRSWLDKGISPCPISVNVSRVNLYNPYFVDSLCNLTDKFDVPRELLNLELTESSYTDNPEAMSTTTKKLRAKGFVVMMDDFGSGYSSLNILKDIEVDVLKIDMKFLSQAEIPGRSENIIASVVRMAKWLNVPVIAEGVEKEEQVEFLYSIGCEFVQGFYFAKPMPVDQYETLMEKGDYFIPKQKQKFDTDSLWSVNPQMEMLFSNMSQAVGIYEFENNHLEILRVNKAFYDLFGYEDVSIRTNDPLKAVKKEHTDTVLNAFNNAINTKSSSEFEYMRKCMNSTIKWVHATLKYINTVGDKSILIGTLTDITTQKEIELELQKYKKVISSNSNYSNKILIVEDIEQTSDALIKIFGEKFDILLAHTGQEAIDLLKMNNNYVDIILLDLYLPVMSGNKFLEYKNSNPDISDIPVIIIADDIESEQQINTLALGVDDYIVKPFIEDVVLKRVNHVLESHMRFRKILREYNNVVAQSHLDSLTKIYNRAAAQKFIPEVLDTRSEQNHALIMLDIDKFKEINDTFGHDFGDEILITVADTIKNFFRKCDIVSRFGGDEFCILMVSIPSKEIALEKCNDLCDKIKSLKIGNHNISITISVGIASNTEEAKSFDELYKNADLALYESKRQGRGRSTLFSSSITRPIINTWVDKEWLIDMLEDSIAIIDLETYEFIFVSNTGMKFLGIDDYTGKKCYESLYGLDAPCKNCVKDKLTSDKYYKCICQSIYLNKSFILKDKLIDFNGIIAHLQIMIDVSNIDDNTPITSDFNVKIKE